MFGVDGLHVGIHHYFSACPGGNHGIHLAFTHAYVRPDPSACYSPWVANKALAAHWQEARVAEFCASRPSCGARPVPAAHIF
jgi:hypothetical protein